MKKATKMISLFLASILTVSAFAGCGSKAQNSTASKTETVVTTEVAQDKASEQVTAKGGKILLLANTASGPVYDFNLAYMDMWTKELGYTYEVIYGDSANDPAGNLSVVKNAMTSDVVGLISMQDGGISDIMTEYPNLYVVGLATEMASVYGKDAAGAAVASNKKFLGTVAPGYARGEDIGKMFAKEVEEKGYKKIAICMAPAFAYPQYAIADKSIREEIAKYNETASEPITIVGKEATVLMFKPLDDTFFNEKDNQNLDAIVGFCAGQSFIYPPLVNAINNKTANPDTKLLTLGLEKSDDLVADVGTGIVQTLFVPNYEEIFYAIAMLDNAIQGKEYKDFTQSEVLDGVYVRITSDKVMSSIKDNSPMLSADMSKVSVSIEKGKEFLTRYNPDATYAQLKEFMESDAFSEKAYEK